MLSGVLNSREVSHGAHLVAVTALQPRVQVMLLLLKDDPEGQE